MRYMNKAKKAKKYQRIRASKWKKIRKKFQSITNNLKQWTKSKTKIKFIRLKCVGYQDEENVRTRKKNLQINHQANQQWMKLCHTLTLPQRVNKTKSKIIRSKYGVNKKEMKEHVALSALLKNREAIVKTQEKKILLNKSWYCVRVCTLYIMATA